MQEERELLECTFKPAVRSPTKDMHVAREYLSEPAWLRLSRPRPVTPQARMLTYAHVCSRMPAWLRLSRPRPVTPQVSLKRALIDS
jgi:hypothetical protein